MSESIANRDAAFECLDIAKAALRAGDHVRAEKFSQKALKLYRCQQVGISAAKQRGFSWFCCTRAAIHAAVQQYSS
jgi:hypothetical protein